LIETAIALIVVAVSVVVTFKYRNLFKKYKHLYEEVTKPKPTPSSKHTSPKALQAQEELQRYLEIRSKVLLRDHFRCQECNYYQHLEVHHIIPRSKGGSDELTNLITLCQRCHAKKHGFKKREDKRKRHTKRNKRKHFKKYIQKHHKTFTIEYPVQSMEDVHPHQEDHSPEADARRQKLYEKWKQNELNQPS
jgi:5-methylcytosine-specific restriction endonuclease McrA